MQTILERNPQFAESYERELEKAPATTGDWADEQANKIVSIIDSGGRLVVSAVDAGRLIAAHLRCTNAVGVLEGIDRAERARAVRQ